METADVGWFAEDALPAGTVGAQWWGPKAFGAIRGERYHTAFDGVRSPIWRELTTRPIWASLRPTATC